MNYSNYISMVRSSLCHVLTELRGNEKRIKRIRENIEKIEMPQITEFPLITGIIDRELNVEIEFYEALNGVYENEVNRLVTILLNEPTEVQYVRQKNE